MCLDLLGGPLALTTVCLMTTMRFPATQTGICCQQSAQGNLKGGAPDETVKIGPPDDQEATEGNENGNMPTGGYHTRLQGCAMSWQTKPVRQLLSALSLGLKREPDRH